MEVIRATISNGYRLRLAVIAVACLLFGGWFLYDHAVGYPGKNEIRHAFERLQEEHPADFHDRWEQLATERNWPTYQPGKPYTQAQIDIQLYMAIPCFLLAGIFAFLILRTFGRRVVCDAAGLSTARLQVPWSRIDGLERDRWKSKGIAHVLYQADGGGRGRLLLDNWKFELEPTRAIYRRVVEHLGLTEPVADAVTDDSQAMPSEIETPDTATERAAERTPAGVA